MKILSLIEVLGFLFGFSLFYVFCPNIFAPSTRPSKDPLIWYRDLDFFCFLSLNILHRNIIKYRLRAIKYTRNMWEGMLQLWKWVKLVVLYAKKSFLFFLKIMFFKAILLCHIIKLGIMLSLTYLFWGTLLY